MTMVLALILVLSLFGYLLGINYQAQKKLRQNALSWIEFDLRARADLLEYFLLEREAELKRLARSNAVSACLVRKETGVLASRDGLEPGPESISRELYRLGENLKIRGLPVYCRLAVISPEGEVIAEHNRDRHHKGRPLKDLGPPLPSSGEFAVLSNQEDPEHLALLSPVTRNGTRRGYVAGWVSLDSVGRVFLKIRREKEDDPPQALDTIVLVAGGEKTAFDNSVSWPSAGNIRRLLSLSSDLMPYEPAPRFFQWREGDRVMDVVAMASRPIKHHIRLFRVMEQGLVMHRPGPTAFLYLFLGVGAVVIGACFWGVRHSARARVMAERLELLDSQKAVIDKANKELNKEISERRKAEWELKKANETLERRVMDRTKKIEQMHEQMLLQEKMASIGQIAAGMAHELNNPVCFVASNFASLKEDFQDLVQMITQYRNALDADAVRDACGPLLDQVRAGESDLQIDYVLSDIPSLFEESQHGFDRIERIIQSEREFSHTGRAEGLIAFNINHAVNNTLEIARNTYKYCAEVSLDLGDIPDVPCVPDQVHQVLLNLVVNSAQAIEGQGRPEKGLISIRTRLENRRVVCRVVDDGPGIPDDICDRVFEPFFTTKPAGKGSGLGLPICYDIIVNKHKGELSVQCPEDGGSLFIFSIPLNP
jgi:signal transduction histidine kinase